MVSAVGLPPIPKAKKKRFKAVKVLSDGWSDWQNPTMKGYLMKCCGCGLVHEVEFRVGRVTRTHADGKGWKGEAVPDGEYRVQIRMKRNEDAGEKSGS